MMTTGEEIFWDNARMRLREMGMIHLDPAHGAAVDAVRWCLASRRRPTDHRQAFLERTSPALLAYLERLAVSESRADWRTLEERIRHHAQALKNTGGGNVPRLWLAAVWHTLPECIALGQSILDRQAAQNAPAPGTVPVAADPAVGRSGDDDTGSSGKTGSAGTTSKPQPTPSFSLPRMRVVPTKAEKKALRLEDIKTPDVRPDDTPVGTDPTVDPAGPKGPGAPK